MKEDEALYWAQFFGLVVFAGIVALTGHWLPLAFYVGAIQLRILHALQHIVHERTR